MKCTIKIPLYGFTIKFFLWKEEEELVRAMLDASVRYHVDRGDAITAFRDDKNEIIIYCKTENPEDVVHECFHAVKTIADRVNLEQGNSGESWAYLIGFIYGEIFREITRAIMLRNTQKTRKVKK